MKTAHKTDKSNNFEPSKSFVYATEENGEASVQLNGKKSICTALVCLALVSVAKAIGGDVCKNIQQMAENTIECYQQRDENEIEENDIEEEP